MDRSQVAVFDFDGTITYKSSTIPFLKFLAGRSFFYKFINRLPVIVGHHLHLITIDQLNHMVSSAFFKDLSNDFLCQIGNDFSSKIIPSLVKESACERFKWHKEQGHFCVLATSAYNIYIDSWALMNGFDACVSTKIAFNKHNRATGALEGKSCYGLEKLRRVKELLGTEPKIIYAYGDSSGDRELLDYATYAHYRNFK